MSTSCVFVSSFCAVARRAAVPQPALRSAVRRAYSSSGHGGSAGAEKSSDLPWLIGSIGVTVPGVAWLLSPGPKKANAHDHHAAPVPDKEESPAAESTPSPPPSDEKEESSSDDNPPTNQSPDSGNPNASQSSSQTGQQVPPPSADNTDMATNYEDKKEGQKDYKEMIERKDTRAATSSSDTPSKKGAAEHPREDPQKGEGDAVQKGGPSS